MDIVTFDDVYVGMRVVDVDGYIGVVMNCDDIHNVHVEYDDGGSGLYCLDEDCDKCSGDNARYYDPLFRYNP